MKNVIGLVFGALFVVTSIGCSEPEGVCAYETYASVIELPDKDMVAHCSGPLTESMCSSRDVPPTGRGVFHAIPDGSSPARACEKAGFPVEFDAAAAMIAGEAMLKSPHNAMEAPRHFIKAPLPAPAQ